MATPEVIESLTLLRNQLERLEPATTHIQAAHNVTRSLESVVEQQAAYLNKLKAQLADSQKVMDKQLHHAIEEMREKYVAFDSVAKALLNDLSIEIASSKALEKMLLSLYEKIDRINFPERLDKLDANVAGIMSAVQSVQGRLDLVERNISDRIRDLSERQRDALAALERTQTMLIHQISQDLIAYSKRQRLYSIVTWGLIAVAIVGSILI